MACFPSDTKKAEMSVASSRKLFSHTRCCLARSSKPLSREVHAASTYSVPMTTPMVGRKSAKLSLSMRSSAPSTAEMPTFRPLATLMRVM